MRSTFALTLLTTSALATAALVTLAAPARAQESPFQRKPTWDISIQGGYGLFDQTNAPLAGDRFLLVAPGGFLDRIVAEPETGFTGKIAARMRLTERWSLGAAYTGLRSNRRSETTGSNYPADILISPVIQAPAGNLFTYATSVTASTRITQHVLDFDAGYDVGLGRWGELKLIGGGRFAQFDQATRSTFFIGGGDIGTMSRDDHFYGFGPRLAASWTVPIAATGFSVNAGIGGSVLFGQFRSKSSIDVIGGREKFGFGRVAYNAEGELSVTYAWPFGLYAALGYQASAWFGISSQRQSVDVPTSFAAGAPSPGGAERSDYIVHGPFLRVGLRW